MAYFDLLNALGDSFNTRGSVNEAYLYGVIRGFSDVPDLGGKPELYAPGVKPAILDVALISAERNQYGYVLGNVAIAINEDDEYLIGKPVMVSKSNSSGVNIYKMFNRAVGAKGGVRAFVSRKVGGDWVVHANHVRPLKDFEIRKKELSPILGIDPDGDGETWKVLYGNMPPGVTQVSNFFGFPSEECRKPISLDKVDLPDVSEDIQGTDGAAITVNDGSEDSDNNPLLIESFEAEKEFDSKPINEISLGNLVFRETVSEGNPEIEEAIEAELENLKVKREEFRTKLLTEFGYRGEDYYIGRMFRDNVVSLLSSRRNKRAVGFVEAVLRKLNEGVEDKVDVNEAIKDLRYYPERWERYSQGPFRDDTAILSSALNANIPASLSDFEHNLLYSNPYAYAIYKGLGLKQADTLRVVMRAPEGQDSQEALKYRKLLQMLSAFVNNRARLTMLNLAEVNRAVDDEKLGQGLPWRSNTITTRIEMLGLPKDPSVLRGASNKLGINTLEASSEEGLLLEFQFQGEKKYVLAAQAEKEMYLYKRLREMASTPSGIGTDVIESSIATYQDQKGFVLEQLQNAGVRIVQWDAGVLSGCAGSGKTTVSEVMTMAIEQGLPEHKVKYAAPTGKAARRLAEVVKRPVKTLHSLFRLGIGEGSDFLKGLVGYRDGNFTAENNVVYIFDEMAMAPIDLLYRSIMSMGEGCKVYFLGDVKQLEPIGQGIPFRDLMNFLPTVELGVSKRSAEGSGINLNCNIINTSSDPIVEKEDFRVLDCSTDDLQKGVVAVCRAGAKKFGWEGVQVVTPYTTSRKSWSDTVLNPILQKEFNKNEPLLTVGLGDTSQTFLKNDRVIHTNTNCWGYKRYLWSGPGSYSFEEVESLGVANGELGTIVGFVHSQDVELNELPLDQRGEGSVEPRVDSDFIDEKTFFVLVKYYDVDICEDVVVFYHAYDQRVPDTESSGKSLYMGDLVNIKLAYALTTHKMQGSQSPVIVVPIGHDANPEFVNRNMIYTALSRASEQVYVVGSVSGSNSAFNQGRKYFTAEKSSLLQSLSKGFK